jgi:hypothetical protein
MGLVLFEIGSWCLAALAMTLAPRTRRRWSLLAASCLAALCAGVIARVSLAPSWNPGKVHPAALLAASMGAVVVAVAFELLEWRSRRVRSSSTT